MEASKETLKKLKSQLVSASTEPPIAVIQAAASVVGDRTVTHAVTTYERSRASGEAGSAESVVATWTCLALTDRALITVVASRTGGEWYMGSDDEEFGGETPVRAGLIPLQEVAGCFVIALRSYGSEMWKTRWELRLRNGETLPIPWPKHEPGREQHENLARALADALAAA